MDMDILIFDLLELCLEMDGENHTAIRLTIS